MKNLFMFLLAGVFFTTSLFLVSCDEIISDINTTPAESAVETMNQFADIFLVVDDGIILDSTKSGMKITGADYEEAITGDFPNKLYRWDFGTEGDYQGVIYILLTDQLTNPGALATITFEDFYHNGQLIDGIQTIENLGVNSNDKQEFRCQLENGIKGDMQLQFDWVIIRNDDGGTQPQDDDIFSISEKNSASGVDKDGVAFELTIKKDVTLDISCEYIVTSGLLEILSAGDLLTADFGEGECDNIVKVGNKVMEVDIFI
ncbi:MAG: hypothetical protein RQ866_07470 [Bacteroidales bacterium]|nr:hypothetical protein [Bacteroidales bacterium]